MSRSTLKFLATILTTGIFVVPFLGLDDLPRDLRSKMAVERKAFETARKTVRTAHEEVARDLQTDPALFQSRSAAGNWDSQFNKADSALTAATRDAEELAKLEKANRRQDREKAQTLLARTATERQQAEAAAKRVADDAAYWRNIRANAPDLVDKLNKGYAAVHNYNLAALSSKVQRAGLDWPAKKGELEARLQSIRTSAAQIEPVWQSTAELRRKAAAKDFAGLDFAALATAAGMIQNAADDVPKQATTLEALTGQLYDSWDKLLVDMETRGSGRDKEYNQKLRTVRTHFEDAAGKAAGTTSDEKWVAVAPRTYDTMRDKLGMTVEHKPVGKYDSEAERVAQPPGFAYMAPPGERNQYGYWNNSGGQSFWVFYGQYALMRDLLFNRGYQPIGRYEYDGYWSSRRSGQTYYGHDASTSTPRYGTQGTATQQSYSSSSYAKSGGFSSSKYATKSGSYKDSQYATPMMRKPEGERGGQTFGRQTPKPTPAPSYRPAPSRAPSMPRSSPGRSFGGGRRR